MNYINRLLSGVVILEVENQTVFVKPFRLEDKILADFLAEKIYEDCFYSDCFTVESAEEFLLKNGSWTEEHENEISSLVKKIEQAKVDYYLGFAIKERTKHIKYNIDCFNDKLSSLLLKKNEFYDKTCEYTANYFKLAFLLEKSSYIDNSHSVKDRINIQRLVSAFNDKSLQETTIREVAKSHEWKTVWGASKTVDGLFDRSANELTNEQVVLISWSRFYDSVHESVDPPTEEVINDDIAFDGWMILQSRKRKEESDKKRAESLMPSNNKDAGELFIPVNSLEEQKQVISLNDGYGMAVLNSKRQDLKEHGHLNEMELSHVRREIQMQSNKSRR